MSNDIPTWQSLRFLIIEALQCLGGESTTKKIDDYIAEKHLHEVDRKKLKRQLSFARTYLRKYGVIANLSLGKWIIGKEYQYANMEWITDTVRRKHKIYEAARKIAESYFLRDNEKLKNIRFNHDGICYYIDYLSPSTKIMGHNFDSNDHTQLLSNIQEQIETQKRYKQRA